MTKEALFYEVLDNKVNCKICPHNCVISEGQVGICLVRKALRDEHNDLKLYTLNYEAVTAVALDSIEKKPLYHFYPGSKILSVGSFGCNFKCSFCQNYAISQYTPSAKKISVNELVNLIKSTEDTIGIAFTYNEPSIWYEYILEASKLIKEQIDSSKNKVVLVSNGYISEEPLKELLPFVDAMNIDLKGDDSYYKKLCKGRLEPVMNTIRLAHEAGCHVEVTTLLIGGENTSLETARLIGDFISSLDKEMPLHLLRYYPMYKMENEATSLDEIKKVYDELKGKLNNIHLGNLSKDEIEEITR